MAMSEKWTLPGSKKRDCVRGCLQDLCILQKTLYGSHTGKWVSPSVETAFVQGRKVCEFKTKGYVSANDEVLWVPVPVSLP
jgi:hypothetical protein